MWHDLVCPVDQGSLEASREWLVCKCCGRGYPVIDNIPTFLPIEEDPRWRLAQKRRVAMMAPAPGDTCAHDRPQASATGMQSRLARFVELGRSARSLQIGLNSSGRVHRLGASLRYGIEPLAGLMQHRGTLDQRRIRWIAGRGEELPFVAGYFEVVLLDGVLDMAEAPQQVLSEAQRCLADDGALWLSTMVCRNPRMAALMPAEPGVLWHFTAEQLEALCQSAGLHAVWSVDEPALSADRFSTGDTGLAGLHGPATLSVAQLSRRTMILRRATNCRPLQLWAA